MAARVRLTPLRLIEVRDGLAARARARLEDERGDYMPFFRMVWERAWGAAGALSVAPAWWVSADMADLAVAAAADGVPEDALPQTMDGFLAFGRDLPADATPDFPWPVRAVHWSAREVGDAGGRGLSVGTQWYTADPRALAEAGEARLPLVQVDVRGEVDTSRAVSVLRAVWALSSEPRVCDVVPGESAPAALWGGGRPDLSMARRVKFLVLRENRRSPFGDDGDGPAREYSHRFIVRGFWRRQPYGPGGSLRRMQWIPPYVKGPADKPLVVKETVRIWRR